MRKFLKSRTFAWSITVGTVIGFCVGVYSRWPLER